MKAMAASQCSIRMGNEDDGSVRTQHQDSHEDDGSIMTQCQDGVPSRRRSIRMQCQDGTFKTTQHQDAAS
jgi:hypothetical protein